MLPNSSLLLFFLLLCSSATAATLELVNNPETGEPGKFAEQSNPKKLV